MKKSRSENLPKLILSLWLIMLLLSMPPVLAISVNPLATPVKLTAKETINLSKPVSSEDELVIALSDSLNRVCENLNLTINNHPQWFTKQKFDQCMKRANSMSSLIRPYYKSYNYTYTTRDNRAIKMNIQFNYKFPRKPLLHYLAEVETEATRIINTTITPRMDDYQKEIALHDYIINHARYDELNYRRNTIPDESYTPYGILIKGTGVCAGYAYTMKYLCDKVGIECIVVSGKGDGGDHAWNIVKIGGEYYHVDVTWDDPMGKDRLSYNYFNLNDEMIAVNHSWDPSLYPKCSATEYNYFHRNDLYVADMDECRKRIEKTIAAHKEHIHMQIAGFSLAVFKKMLQTVVAEQRFYGRYTYIYDEKLGIVEIKFEYSD